MQSKTPTFYTKSLDSVYGIELLSADSLYKLGIHGVSQASTASDDAYKITHLGDLTEDGSYAFPLHCHGDNLVGGEEFAAAVLEKSQTNANLTASVENGQLTFTSRSNQPLFPTGRLRGANPETFTLMLIFSAPENTGSITSTGVAFTFSTGIQNISYTKSYSGQVVQVLSSSNASRQLLNLTIASTAGKKRIIDLSSFGVFHGTVTVNDFVPYWGEKTSFFLSEPLRSFSGAEDVAYPLQGYVSRYVRSIAYHPTSAEKFELGSSYPTYRIPLPEALREKELRLDHFARVESTNALIANALQYMRTADQKYVLVTADTSYNTVDAFLSFFNELNVNIEYKVSTPVIESFTPISLATRAGRNYIDLMTEIAPAIMDFTYQ